MEQADAPKFNPKLVASTWWNTFNSSGEEAEYTATQDPADLPLAVRTAITTVKPERGGLGEEDVNWNLTCVSQDGTVRLRRTEFLPGGGRSGRTCGENSLWAVPEGVNKMNVPSPRGSAAFGYLKSIYVIDAGLCPCARCAKSLLGLAERLESTIVVRPMVDYQMIRTSRTKLSADETYLLLFTPGAKQFLVYHSSSDETPSKAKPRDVTNHPLQAWMRCPSFTCKAEYSLVFPTETAKRREVKVVSLGATLGKGQFEEYPSVTCPKCKKNHLELVREALGSFPKATIDYQ